MIILMYHTGLQFKKKEFEGKQIMAEFECVFDLKILFAWTHSSQDRRL